MNVRWLILIWAVAAGFLTWWTVGNPLPDGFQNEYLHVGNAYDLWLALVDFDVWHVRWYMYTGYWPWGFYAVPWPFLAVLGPGRMALLLGNLVHLAVLLWGMHGLSRALGARLAPILLVLCPGVFGSLVRFEPNLADIAWVALGLSFLVQCQALRSRRHVLGWAGALGMGLMMDRLTVVFFLVPAVLPLLWGARRRAWHNLALGGGLTLLLTGAYYREFFLRHTDELMSQAPVGEIDAAGQITAAGGVFDALYYPLSLVDSQAGPVTGLLMLWGLFAAVRAVWPQGGQARPDGVWRPRAVLITAVVVPTIFFTLIAKKQVYYTLPVLAPLAVLAAARAGRGAWLGVAFGLYLWGGAGLGLWQPKAWLPLAWVYPRHTLARAPTHQTWPFDEAVAALGDADQISVMSQDDRLFEGFLALAVRERRPAADVRGVITDPNGTYELFHETDALVWVGAAGGGWPDEEAILRELLADHYSVDQLPPVARVVADAEAAFELVGRFPEGDMELVVFVRSAGD